MSQTSEVVPAADVQAGQSVTQGFGEQSLARLAETSSVALAEQAKAAVQARYIVAMQRPRELRRTRDALLADCKRPAFAEAAIYNKPVGDGVEGPSIRFAEAAARAMGNIYADVATIYDDREKRIVRVSATDLEANVTYPMDITIAKTVERSKPQEGRKVLMVRKNSKGRDVYTIEATDDEILDRERSLASKALRTCILRLVPGDISEEAIEQCYRTRDEEMRKDLPGARRKMVGAYQSLDVTEAQLAEYLGHAISDTTAEELAALRGLYQALKDKETTWAEALDAKRAERATAGEKQGEDLGARLSKKAADAKASEPPKKASPDSDAGELAADGLPKGF